MQKISNAIKNKVKFEDIEDNEVLYWYKDIYEDMKVNEMGLIILDDKILVPKSERKNCLERAHLGHPGIQKMKKTMNTFYFYEGLSKDVAKMASECHLCQTFMQSNI